MVSKNKRGVSKCKKKFLTPEKFQVDFKANGIATGDNAQKFMSWVGLEFKKRIPYDRVAKKVDPQLYDDVWAYIKQSWKIPNDNAKKVTLAKGKAIMKHFRHMLKVKYVDVGRTPFKDYDYLDPRFWNSLIANVSTDDWQENSSKSKISAKKNIDPARVGRAGISGLDPTFESRWNQLVSSYPHLAGIQDERSKLYTVSRSHLNPVTKLYELGSKHQLEGELTGVLKELFLKEKEMKDNGTYDPSKTDVVTEVVGKGHQHGGRTRLYCDVIGFTKSLFPESESKKKKTEAIDTAVAKSSNIHGLSHSLSHSSGNKLPEIKFVQKCELLRFDGQCSPMVIGKGRVHPTPERTIHGRPMKDGFVKVQVDKVEKGCTLIPLLPESCILDEVELLGDAKGYFIQWPMESIKILNTTSSSGHSVIPQCHSVSQQEYIPQNFEVRSPCQQETMLRETNEYERYVYALQDDECLNELIADDQLLQNQTKSAHFYQPTKPIIAHEHTEPINVYQSTNNVHAYQPTKVVSKCQPSKVVLECQPTKVVSESQSVECVSDSQPTKPLPACQPTEPVAFSKPSKQRTTISKLLKKAKSRSQNIYTLAQQVAIKSEKAYSVNITSPVGMYEECVEENVEYEAVLKLCVNGLVDDCFMHWFIMYLYAIGRKKGLDKTAYFHLRYIDGDFVTNDSDFVINHIKSVISLHNDKHWFMAPHLLGQHWVLILLQHYPTHETWKGHIFDSRKGTKDPSSFMITELFEKAIQHKIAWNLADCRQQPNGWESGYCVMMAMHDIVISNREHILVNKRIMVRQAEINEFVERTLKVLISLVGVMEAEDEEEDV